MDREALAKALRRLGWAMWIGIAFGYSVDGRPLISPFVALVVMALVAMVAQQATDRRARNLLVAAAGAAFAWAVFGAAAWAPSLLKASVEAGIVTMALGFLLYSLGLLRWCQAAGWPLPVKYLQRAVVGFAVAIVVSIAMFLMAAHAGIAWRPEGGGEWPGGFLQGRTEPLATAWWVAAGVFAVAWLGGMICMGRGHRSLRDGMTRPLPAAATDDPPVTDEPVSDEPVSP